MVAGAAGLNVQDFSIQPSFADVNNDGDLDMFLLCNEPYRLEGRPKAPPTRKIGGAGFSFSYGSTIEIFSRVNERMLGPLGNRSRSLISRSPSTEGTSEITS